MNPSNIAIENPEKLENMITVFDISNIEYICPRNNKKHNAQTLLVPRTSMTVADLVFSDEDVLLFNSKFEKILKFYFSQYPDVMPRGIIYELGPNSYQEVDCNIAKSPENKFLIFINISELDGVVDISFL
jgi:hypothetical protein